MIYVVIERFSHESDEVLGAFLNRESAEIFAWQESAAEGWSRDIILLTYRENSGELVSSEEIV